MSAQLLERFSDTSILVIGDYMLDEYIMGSVERISPEAPVPVVLEKSRKVVPGGAGNVVANLRALGARARVCGLVGADAAAERMRGMFLDMGAEQEHIALRESSTRPTIRKIRILAGNQQVCRVDRESAGPIETEDEDGLLDFIRASLPGIKAIVFSDYDKGVVTPRLIRETTAAAREHGVFISVDPQVSHFNYYQGVGVLTPNHHEAGGFLGRKLVTDEQIRAGGMEILERLQARMLLITRGEKGMTLFEADKGECRHFPTQAREVFDVSGAGDTVISLFTLVIASGGTPEQAVEISNRGAGIVVGKVGTATVTREELAADDA